jgi:hypothetical protein
VSELVFDCVGADPDRYSAVPGLTLRLRIAETSGAKVAAIALRCQVRIEPQRRRYSAEEAARLHDLFGDTGRWAETVKPIQLAALSTMVPTFTGSIDHDLALPVTYDMEIASAKYFTALDDGVIPLLLLYSGTVFSVEDGRMSVAQVPWSKETAFPLPVHVWRDTVARHFPDSAWLRVGLETMDRLRHYKSRNALPTWDSTLAALLSSADSRRDASC